MDMTRKMSRQQSSQMTRAGSGQISREARTMATTRPRRVPGEEELGASSNIKVRIFEQIDLEARILASPKSLNILPLETRLSATLYSP